MVDLTTARASFRAEAIQGRVDTGRASLPYWSWGSGPPLVCIHGVSDIGLSFLLPAYLLRNSFRVIAYNQASGQGDGADLASYTHGYLVDDLFALLDHLKLERATLFGVSFGTTIALAALARDPDRLPRGILQGGLAYRRLNVLERLAAQVARYLPGPTAWIPFVSVGCRFMEYHNFQGLPHERWRFYLDCWTQDSIASLCRKALLLDQLDLRPLLPGIRQPILRITGDRDLIVSRAVEARLDPLPNARKVEFRACGHMPCHTHPELLAESIGEFLSE
jgi:pimeloyl-ACP methyl ester carboxylesterase